MAWGVVTDNGNHASGSGNTSHLTVQACRDRLAGRQYVCKKAKSGSGRRGAAAVSHVATHKMWDERVSTHGCRRACRVSLKPDTVQTRYSHSVELHPHPKHGVLACHSHSTRLSGSRSVLLARLCPGCRPQHGRGVIRADSAADVVHSVVQGEVRGRRRGSVHTRQGRGGRRRSPAARSLREPAGAHRTII